MTTDQEMAKLKKQFEERQQKKEEAKQNAGTGDRAKIEYGDNTIFVLPEIEGHDQSYWDRKKEENNMTEESYRADKLLPILEKTNAYGLKSFKKLINF